MVKWLLHAGQNNSRARAPKYCASLPFSTYYTHNSVHVPYLENASALTLKRTEREGKGSGIRNRYAFMFVISSKQKPRLLMLVLLKNNYKPLPQ